MNKNQLYVAKKTLASVLALDGKARFVFMAKYALGLSGEKAFQIGAWCREVGESIKGQAGESTYPFHLGGVAELKVPGDFKKGKLKADMDGMYGYGPTQGLPAARQAAAEHFGKLLGIDFDASEAAIVNAKQGLYEVYGTLVNPGDLVSHSRPGYPIPDSVTHALGAKVETYTFNFKRNKDGSGEVSLDFESLAAVIAKQPKILSLETINPTGVKLSEKQVAQLADLLAKSPNTIVIFDIAYLRIQYEGESYLPPLIQQLWKENRCAIVCSYSKAAAIPGERIGTVFLPNGLKDASTKRRAMDVFNTLTGNINSHLATSQQYGLINMLKPDQHWVRDQIEQNAQLAYEMDVDDSVRVPWEKLDAGVKTAYLKQGTLTWRITAKKHGIEPGSYAETLEENRQVLEERRAILSEALRQIPGVVPYKAVQAKDGANEGAGFYVFSEVTDLVTKLGFKTYAKQLEHITGEPHDPNLLFVKTLMEQTGIAVVPDIYFSIDRTEEAYDGWYFVRFAFSGISKTNIVEAMAKLKNWIAARAEAIKYWDNKRVAVTGGGPVGRKLAHDLYKVGADVTIVTRHSYDDIAKNGIHVHTPTGETVSAPKVAKSLGELKSPFDVILDATQVGKSDEDGIVALLKKGGQYSCFKNGPSAGQSVTEKLMAAHDGDVTCTRSVISVQIKADENGHLHIPKEISYPIGLIGRSSDGDTAKAQEASASELANALAASGVKKANAVTSAGGNSQNDIAKSAWIKTMKNFANLVALSLAIQEKGITYGDVLTPSETGLRKTLFAAVSETYGVMQKAGVTFGDTETAEFYYQAVLRYVATSHICTTVNAYGADMPLEDFYTEILEMGGGADAMPGLAALIESIGVGRKAIATRQQEKAGTNWVLEARAKLPSEDVLRKRYAENLEKALEEVDQISLEYRQSQVSSLGVGASSSSPVVVQ